MGARLKVCPNCGTRQKGISPLGWVIAIIFALLIFGSVWNEAWYASIFSTSPRQPSGSRPAASSSSSRPPAPSFRVVSLRYRVTERNNVWWKYSWILTIRNNVSAPLKLWVTIKFKDADGFIVDQNREYDLHVPAGSEQTFTGFDLISCPEARSVRDADAEVRAAPW